MKERNGRSEEKRNGGRLERGEREEGRKEEMKEWRKKGRENKHFSQIYHRIAWGKRKLYEDIVKEKKRGNESFKWNKFRRRSTNERLKNER